MLSKYPHIGPWKVAVNDKEKVMPISDFQQQVAERKEFDKVVTENVERVIRKDEYGIHRVVGYLESELIYAFQKLSERDRARLLNAIENWG